MMKFIVGLMFFLNILTAHANPQSVIWFNHDALEKVTIHVDLFLSSTCPHCQKADAFFREIEPKKPWLVVHRHIINQDKVALQTFYTYLQQQNSNNFSVPAIFFCDSRWAGFASKETTGKALLHALTYCRKKISEQGELSPVTINVLRKWGGASQFQISTTISQSVSTMLLLSAIMDALSPCSLFCFAAFLAFLWLYPTRKWLQFNVGLCFLLSLGVVHYLQQVHTAFYYELTPQLKWPAVFSGLLLLFFVLNDYRKNVSQDSMKSGLLLFSVLVCTVFVVQIYQQTCVFNAAFVLEQWMTEHAISPAMRHFYQMIYQFIYLMPLTCLLLFYLMFGRYKRMTAYQDKLKIAACFILVSIGVILIVYPLLLANLLISFGVLIVSIFIAWVYTPSPMNIH